MEPVLDDGFVGWSMVREVGFEPTNPCGTGASGLRLQGPTLGPL